MQFKPGNIINEYYRDRRDGFKDSWVSSYLIIEEDNRNKNIKCLCIFDFDQREEHLPGRIINVSTDIARNHDCADAYWKEVEP